jgi:hypothetical protein|tara:strand:+ start:166 stop:450 length:285 start_codon:yes stop_codon:yes gene_type:complete
MKRPTKKSFYECMSLKYNRKFGKDDSYLYDQLIEIIAEASKDSSRMMELAELTVMSKSDRLIYRNNQACKGIELTPIQVDMYLSTIEFGLEYIT